MDLENLRQEAPGNLAAFFGAYLQPHLRSCSLSPPFHRKLFRLLPVAHRLIIAAPRAHAKSTLCSFAFPLWCAVTSRKHEIIIVSKTTSLAEDWLDKIKVELTSNEALIADFGLLRGRKWGHDMVLLKNGTKIYAKGQGFQIRGYRPDLIVLDDIEDEESVRSDTQSRHLEDWFDSALVNTLDAGVTNQLVMIGNYIGPTCLLKKKIDRIRRGHMGNWEAHVFHATPEKPLWPQKWDRAALKQRKAEIGPTKFASEFENNPMPEGVTVFAQKWLRYHDNKIPERINKFIAIDTADSQKKQGDPSCIMVGGMDAKKNLYVVAYERKRFSPMEFWDALFRLHKQHQPIRTGVEAHTWKNHFHYTSKAEMERRNHHFWIKDLKPVTDRVTFAKPLADLCEQGRFYISKDQHILEAEMLHYPFTTSGMHDDCVACAIWLARMAFASAQPGQSEATFRTTPGSPLDQLRKTQGTLTQMEDVVFTSATDFLN